MLSGNKRTSSEFSIINDDNKKRFNDNSVKFQYLIDSIGTPNILNDFTYYLGRDNCEIISEGKLYSYHYGEKITELCINNGIKTRIVNVPEYFSGLFFDGIHWKAYEDGKEKYNSYTEDIQIVETNNYCQGYACFLWASKGLYNKIHNVTMEKKNYINNVKVMSTILLNYLESKETQDEKKWLISAFEGYDLILIKNILKELSIDENSIGKEFSQSKE